MAHSRAQAARRYSLSGSEVVGDTNTSSLIGAIYFSPLRIFLILDYHSLVTLHDIYNTYYV
jgi:hypothetical protein